MTYQTHLTRKSRNKKTGPIPVSTTTYKTCPDACPFKGAGCYADVGPLALHWRKVTEGRTGSAFNQFLQQVADLPDGQLWRHNQAGDLPGDGETLDADAVEALANASAGKQGFTYTHYDAAHPVNRTVIARANSYAFTINLSGNSPAHADKLADLQIAPVVTVLPSDLERRKKGGEWVETLAEYRDRIADVETPQGRKVVVCPATYQDDVSCATCKLCARQRDAIVGFPAHGTSKRKADLAVAESDAESLPDYQIAAE